MTKNSFVAEVAFNEEIANVKQENVRFFYYSSTSTQQAFACSESIMKTLEKKGVKCVQSYDVVVVFLLLTLTIFQTFF